jgi:hypothetical protein
MEIGDPIGTFFPLDRIFASHDDVLIEEEWFLNNQVFRDPDMALGPFHGALLKIFPVAKFVDVTHNS